MGLAGKTACDSNLRERFVILSKHSLMAVDSLRKNILVRSLSDIIDQCM